MTITDDQIAAWLHGALNEEEATLVADSIAGDPELALRADRLRHLDTLVRQAVPLEDSLPPELLARLGLPTTPEHSNIVDLASARAARVDVVPMPATPKRGLAAFAGGGWRIAAQVLIVVGIGVGVTQWANAPRPAASDAPYRALGDAPTAAPVANVLLVLDTGTDAGRAQAVAGRVGAHIVGAPTATGAWRLRVDPAQRDAALTQLKALPEVRMALAIDGPGQ